MTLVHVQKQYGSYNYIVREVTICFSGIKLNIRNM